MQVSSSISMQSMMARARVQTSQATPKTEATQTQDDSVKAHNTGRHASRIERAVTRLDSDASGGVSMEELQGSKLGKRIDAEKFARIDGDSDGQVTADEALSYLQDNGIKSRGLGGLMGRRAHGHVEAASADALAQLAESQAATSVTTTKVEFSFVSVSIDSFETTSGGSFAEPAVPGDQMTAPAPTEMTPAEDMAGGDTAAEDLAAAVAPEAEAAVTEAAEAPTGSEAPSAAMEELQKIETEAAAEELVESEGLEGLDDLFGDIDLEALASMDPMEMIAELAEMMTAVMQRMAGGEEAPAAGADTSTEGSTASLLSQRLTTQSGGTVAASDDAAEAGEAEASAEAGESVGALSSDVSDAASFGPGEFSLQAFSFEATQTTTTLADGSSTTSLSVNVVALSAYSRTMEMTAAA